MKNTQAQKLKRLQTKLSDINKALTEKIDSVKLGQAEISKLKIDKANIKKDIDKLRNGKSGPLVTEHAMLRYFERVLGYDLKEIESKIATDELKAKYEAIGNGLYEIDGEFKAKIENGAIVTVY